LLIEDLARLTAGGQRVLLTFDAVVCSAVTGTRLLKSPEAIDAIECRPADEGIQRKPSSQTLSIGTMPSLVAA